MHIGITKQTWGTGDLSWLGSLHGSNNCYTVTLDVKKFAAVAKKHDGVIPSGTPLKINNTSGKYEPVAAAADTCEGFLLASLPAKEDTQAGALFWHGRVFTDRLPAGVFDVTTLTTKPAQITMAKKGA